MQKTQTETTPVPTSSDKVLARIRLDPSVSSAITLSGCHGFNDVDFHDLIDELDRLTLRGKNHVSHSEATLLTQSCILDALFHHLCRMSLNNPYSKNFRPEFLELALKTQRHYRATLETLKNVQSSEKNNFQPNELEVNNDAAMDR